jgi:hypothetical protein
VRTNQTRREIRYETIIATLVGVSALFVSGYTAYVQRQQVRAAVWPILAYTTSNEPNIRFIVENKGVGPAIVRRVVVTIDGQPARNWDDALQKLAGPGNYQSTQSTISGHIFSAGESLTVLMPKNSEGAPLSGEKSGPLWATLDRERRRVAVEICYCSTLGECWTLRSGGNTRSTTTEARSCPETSAISFEQ